MSDLAKDALGSADEAPALRGGGPEWPGQPVAPCAAAPRRLQRRAVPCRAVRASIGGSHLPKTGRLARQRHTCHLAKAELGRVTGETVDAQLHA